METNDIDSKFKIVLNLIYEERIAQKYTQKDVAEYLNINTGSYNLIENGKQKNVIILM